MTRNAKNPKDTKSMFTVCMYIQINTFGLDITIVTQKANDAKHFDKNIISN